MEQQTTTERAAPMRLGPVEIPGMLSWLATGDPDATVVGLEEFPVEDRPHSIVHLMFRLMVGLGSLMALYAVIALYRLARKRPLDAGRWWLTATMLLAPAGAIATEAGWIVTEVGRQPWTIYGVLRTTDAATPLGMIWLPFSAFTLIYIGLGAVVLAVLARQVRETT
jgi:cytochrome d ubiquinol oxidase subunit I